MGLPVFWEATLEFFLHHAGSVLREQRGKLQGLLRPRLWGLTQWHFCHILIVKARQKTSPDSRAWETDFIACWEKQQNHCKGSHQTGGSMVTIFASKLSPLLEELSMWYWIIKITKDLTEVGGKRLTTSQVLKSSKHEGVLSDTVWFHQLPNIFIVSSVNANEYHQWKGPAPFSQLLWISHSSVQMLS